MQRRDFLLRLGGALITVPAVLELAGCGDDPAPAAPSNGYDVTSTNAGGHTHRIRVLCGDLTAGGAVTYTSTATDHTHRVSLTMAEVSMIVAGGEVIKTSSLDSSHTHDWTIRTPSGTC